MYTKKKIQDSQKKHVAEKKKLWKILIFDINKQMNEFKNLIECKVPRDKKKEMFVFKTNVCD